jgi:two-component system phosphate regulon response regulator PhoB
MDGSILLIEEDSAVRDLLAGNLGHAGYRVHCTRTLSEATALVHEIRPDLALLDWMPGVPGLTFTRELRSDQRTSGVSIIIVSARLAEQDRVAALESGADDYVTKPFSMRELLARVKAVLRRRAPQLADEILEIPPLCLDPAARRVWAGSREIDLRKTEFQLLHFFMAHPSRTFGRRKLLDEIWGDHVFVEERTVDVHIRRLRHALATMGHEEVIETVRGVGYRLRNEPIPAPSPVLHSTMAALGNDAFTQAALRRHSVCE